VPPLPPRRLVAVVLAALLLAAGAPARAGTFGSGTYEKRPYRLYVPTTVEPSAPLVLALHGCWQTPDDFALGTQLNEAAERRGLVVLYPEQGRRRNPYRCWNWFDPENHTARGAETASLLGMMRSVREQRGLRDPRAIVLGLSAGGFMAVNLACVAPEAVAGIGVSAGGPFRCGVGPQAAIQCMRGSVGDVTVLAAACAEAGGGRPPALRASLWHGALDPVVSPADLAALEAMFVRLLGTPAGTTETVPHEGAVHVVRHDRHGVPVLETWLVSGMEHAWSGGDARGSHTFPPGPNATERMLDFLLVPAPARAAPRR
jgi:poly(hydroxyalkanoate) depolymerase family esterase